MNIICRAGVIEDIPKLSEIERHSTPNLIYLEGAKDVLFDSTSGELMVAEEDGEPIGFGRFTLQYDNAAWLEILRVHEAHQNKGCGTEIWKRIMELCDIHSVPAVRMYTGENNIASRTLAERNGLSLAWEVTELALERDDAAAYPAKKESGAPDFKRITDPGRIADLMELCRPQYKGYFCTNRTFYSMGEPLYEGFTSDFSVWESNGSMLSVGARFLKERALHIGNFYGDYESCIYKAVSLFMESGVPRLVTVVDAKDKERISALTDAGFKAGTSTILMLERCFK